MKIYLVQDCLNSPGKIYAIFNDEESAKDFASLIESDEDGVSCTVVPRTLFHGQPPNRGFNR